MKCEIFTNSNEMNSLSVNNILIHSKYEPKYEAEVFVEFHKEFFDDDIVVIYGLGLGYHILEFMERCNTATKVYVFEGNKQVFELSIKYGLHKELSKFKNLSIITMNNTYFYNELSNKIQMVNDIIVHKASLITLKDMKLKSVISNYIIEKRAFNRSSKLLEENSRHNISGNYKVIDEFLGKLRSYSKSFIIASAGPSLDLSMSLLKSNNEKFIIISVGSALRTLMDNGIKPDVVVIIDGQEIVYNQIKGYENEDFVLCFLSTASPWAIDSYNGTKYIFFNDDDALTPINTGKTVAVAAIDIAVKAGAREIILLGQDLAFIEGKTHTASFEETYGCEDKVEYLNENRTVIGVAGKVLYTTVGYLYFKEQIENLIESNPKVKFINASLGAEIKGALHKKFDEICG